ncbi:MAG TPA: L-threonylcarbamoyladenylate synthase [Oscillatoriaceae cyanobacterium M33_DOE_052]|uniref:L-threonylcarbamoyladenylate synthase n=1 Tax=Planktothricoides sp. SpSt-374 TaxID=2282167 RepID=A0A7C3VUC8_9CYAN|nr:L-threonylcarbamoyladenylate synthase [Oscillatoriaceae cyanobacterium M33_DOE_052]
MTLVSIPDLIAGARAGKLVSFPTDTVPALAARPDRADLIFAAKERSEDKPLILMAATPADLWPYVSGTPEMWAVWQQVAANCWPGALTLVLPASSTVPRVVNPQTPDTIGIRVPNHTIALAILAQTGPLATTSANHSGEPALTVMAEIDAKFPEVLVYQGEIDAAASGLPSTVAKWRGNGWEILRQGAVNKQKLEP